MADLTITLLTASVIGLMFIWLSARVIGSRVSNEVSIGDDNITDLHYRIRTHGNFAEYSPIFLIILALNELSGANETVLIVLASLFVVARVLHVLGMGESANLLFRQAGIIGSFTSILGVSLYGLYLGFA